MGRCPEMARHEDARRDGRGFPLSASPVAVPRRCRSTEAWLHPMHNLRTTAAHPVTEPCGGKLMFIGIDTHKDTLAVSCVDSAGREVAQRTFANTPAGCETVGLDAFRYPGFVPGRG